MFPDYPQLPQRASGILLHPTSFPSTFGIGDLGPAAHAWIQWLAKTGCSLWQFLPLGPTGFADSPYQSFSAFAGNHLLISPQALIEQGLLAVDEVEEGLDFPADQVAYEDVIPWKEEILERMATHFLDRASSNILDAFVAFSEEEQSWLEDYALFMALKHAHKGKPWTQWSKELRDREVAALKDAQNALQAEVQAQKVWQYLFSFQWSDLKHVARKLGVSILGDMPIFVAHDSADVWANRSFFKLDSFGQPTVVAGVPPDYFSSTGQRWGNPLYAWDAMADDDYGWWVARVLKTLTQVDVIRLDHFRGFEASWEIPSSEETAVKGQWVQGPGRALLDRLSSALHGLPLIAEDLGVITKEVINLRTDYKLPGMKVMQFGLEAGPDHEFLPRNYEEGFIAYTGTHDNDTSVGWYQAAKSEIQHFARSYLSSDGDHIAWDMLEALWDSAASWVIVPMQDPLELGSGARMNFPSRTHGNWQWRLRAEQLSDELAGRLRNLNHRHDR